MRKELNSCFYSSFVYFTNALLGFYYQQILYSIVFMYLFLTSIYYHWTYNRLSFLLDQIGCMSGGIYTFYLTIDYIFRISVYHQYISLVFTYMFCLAYTMFTYYCGIKFQMFSHHKNKKTGNYFHSLLHLISSIGCHVALYLSLH